MRVRVFRKTVEAQDVCSFELVSASGENLPPFSAGAHIDVQLPNGLTRQYSLCNPSTETDRYLIAVLRDSSSRGGSTAAHEQVHVGDELTVSEPKNHFSLVYDSTRSLLFAGGIGITPILCMSERLAVTGADFVLHYCSRSRDRMAFANRIGRSAFASRAHFHFDDGPADQKLNLGSVIPAPQEDTHIYVCGPKGFIDAVLGAARDRNWLDANLHFESFTAIDIDASGDQPFQVKVASSGRIVDVPADKTVVHALAEIGIQVPTSCQEGLCGTCLTRVLEGTPDHRDVFQMPAEQARNDQFTPCCSRSKSPMLVLDL